jgi:nucleoid DNA-binding protein
MNEKITLQDIVNLFSQKQGIGKKEADLIVRTMFDLIEEALKTENYVKIKGFGTFKLTEVDARESVNVNTGERFEIQGHSKISFTPDTTMKDLINKPFAHFETVVLNDGVELEDTPTEIVADVPEAMEEAPVIMEEAPAETEETPVVVEEASVVEETPVVEAEETTIEEVATEVTEEPVVVEEVAEEEPIIEEAEEKVVAIETPVAEEEVATTPMVEEKPVTIEEKPLVAETKTESKEKTINRILWGVIVVLVLIILFGAYWMFLRPSDTTEVPVVIPEVQEEVASLKEDTIKKDTLFESEPPIFMQPLKLTAEELRKERVPALADTLEYLINGKEPICEHTLKSGETIIRISVEYYGSKRFWPYIAKFNSDEISNPDNIPIGTIIKIPAIVPKE